MFQIIHGVSGVESLNAWGKGPTDFAVKDRMKDVQDNKQETKCRSLATLIAISHNTRICENPIPAALPAKLDYRS